MRVASSQSRSPRCSFMSSCGDIYLAACLPTRRNVAIEQVHVPMCLHGKSFIVCDHAKRRAIIMELS